MMNRLRFRPALFTLVVGLCAAGPAGADFIYNFEGQLDAGGTVTGSFTVPDQAIADGLIDTDDISQATFTVQSLVTFSFPGVGGSWRRSLLTQ